MNKQELAAMVAEILSGMEHEPPVKGGDYRPTAPQPEKAPTPYRDGDFVPDVTALDLRKLYLVEHAENEEKFRKMKEKRRRRTRYFLRSARTSPPKTAWWRSERNAGTRTNT